MPELIRAEGANFITGSMLALLAVTLICLITLAFCTLRDWGQNFGVYPYCFLIELRKQAVD